LYTDVSEEQAASNYKAEDGGSMFLRNIGVQVDYTAQQPRIILPFKWVVILVWTGGVGACSTHRGNAYEIFSENLKGKKPFVSPISLSR
jgi:hypothetical protein